MRILLIEDDESLCEAVGAHLRSAGYLVDCCHSGDEGLCWALEDGHDLILLDRMLPALDGLTLLCEARRRGLRTPVLLLTALGSVGDRVDGLDAGADDYLCKPFAVEELLARVRALCRRPQQLEDGETLEVFETRLSPQRKSLAGPDGECRLSRTEAAFLELFFRNPGLTLTREQIFLRVWGSGAEAEEKSIDNYAHFSRRRLRSVGSGARLATVRGVGYRLERQEEA